MTKILIRRVNAHDIAKIVKRYSFPWSTPEKTQVLWDTYCQIGIGVGLYADYGPAQKLYFQLGYAPEGNGITYKGQPTTAGQTYPLDDDLIFWLVKSL